MNHRRSCLLSLLIVTLFLCLAAPLARAQDDDEDAEMYRNISEVSSLSVQFDKDGIAWTKLTIQGKLDDPSAVQQALIQSFSFPMVLEQTQKYPYGNRRRDSRDSLSFILIQAHSEKPLSSDNQISAANLRLARLAEVLKPIGVKSIWVTILFQNTPPNLKVTGATRQGSWGFAFAQTRISTDNPGTARIDLAWGYRPGDIWMQLVPLAVFLLLPVLLTLWVRWLVLKIQDPAGMWGRYARFWSWLMSLVWLVWIPLYSWSHLTAIIRMLLGPRGRIASEMISAGLCLGPPLLALFFCHLVSGKVYRRVRGVEWSPAAVVKKALLTSAVWFVPFFLFLAIMGTLSERSRYLRIFLVLGIVLVFLAIQRGGRSAKLSMYAVTSGELRDRIFDLAARAGVKLKQIYVLPDSKAQTSNAFARSDNSVMLTGSLLKHLSKREVDVIMAHEIGHLKEKHPQRKGTISMITLVVASFVASLFSSAIMFRGLGPLMFSLTILASTFVLHFLSRSNERHADAIGIGLTGDPDAFISGMARISRLNLMPMHAGGWGESLSTHPRTLGRLQDIARIHRVSPERFQELLSPEYVPDSRYSVEQIGEAQTKVFSSEFKRKQSVRIALVVLVSIMLMPVLVAFLLARFELHGAIMWMSYVAGAIVTFALYQVFRNYAASWGMRSLERRFRARLSEQGFAEAARLGIFVGLAPSATPARYEKCVYWDIGVLWLVNDQLFYLGEEAWFRMSREQVVDCRIDAVEASWLARNCMFVNWHDEPRGSKGSFYLMSGAGSILRNRRELSALYERLDTWLKNPAMTTPSATMPDLTSPTHRDITSEPAKMALDPVMLCKSCVSLFFMTFGLGALLSVPFWTGCYAIAVVLSLLVLDELPKLFHGGLAKRSSGADPQAQAYQPRSWVETDAVVSRQE